VRTGGGRELVRFILSVAREVEAAGAAHLGSTLARQLRDALLALREITDPFAVLRPR